MIESVRDLASLPQKMILDILRNRIRSSEAGQRDQRSGAGRITWCWTTRLKTIACVVACTGFTSAMTFLLSTPSSQKLPEKRLVALLYSTCLPCACAQMGSQRDGVPMLLKAVPPPLSRHTVGNSTKGSGGNL